MVLSPKVSIGVALADGDGAGGDTLLGRADTAMYECKRTRSDRVVYEASMERLTVERLRLLTGDPGAADLGARDLVEEPE